MHDKNRLSVNRQLVGSRINQMMDQSFGCAEAFVTAVSEVLWDDVDDSVKMISTGFSGGVGGSHEELCGGVSGAAIIMGLLYGRTTNDESKMVKCKELISEHRDRFVQEFGSTTCQKLRDAKYGSDEENPCSALIVPAATMLLDILDEEKERTEKAVEDKSRQMVSDHIPLEEYQIKFQDENAEVLLSELEEMDLPHTHREWIGDRLDSMGDHRPGVGLLRGSLPDIEFITIPSGMIEIERAGKFEISECMISKYPVTSIQYHAFLDDPNGYGNPAWFQDLGLKQEADKPAGEQRFVGDNYPRENISWFDAVAFCRWLNYRILQPNAGIDLPIISRLRDHNWEIRLPTEWEWQMAATGGKPEMKFPWGAEWNQNRAHTKHNQINKTMAVGMYPAGASPLGALDMSGNVWEWCLNCYQDPGDLDLSRKDRRVLRGGSWYHWGSYAHTDIRSRYYPDHRYNAGGFRVACGKTLTS